MENAVASIRYEVTSDLTRRRWLQSAINRLPEQLGRQIRRAKVCCAVISAMRERGLLGLHTNASGQTVIHLRGTCRILRPTNTQLVRPLINISVMQGSGTG